jgi:predicted nucleic acid-binding protein
MTTKGVSSLFIDTNILIYSVNTVSPWHHLALNALQTARSSGSELVISPQILREYLAVATRPMPSGSGVPMATALSDFRLFQAQFRVVQDNQAVLSALDTLLQNFVVGGKQVFDTNIVATMQAYGISHLLTHNTADFTRFATLITVIPLIGVAP